jgi:DNA replication and repair protein RecF
VRPLVVADLAIRSFRNLARIDVEFGARFNVVAGENGQGKTNLLEAIYCVATSKSFRTARVGELVGFGAELASVRAIVHEESEARTQSVGLQSGSRIVRIDDKRPPSLAAYAVRTPVVVFHPGEIALSMGGSSERRRLLDRTALYVSPQSMVELESYTRALKERQRALETRGVSASDLGEWETLCVRHGLAVMQHREAAAELLATEAKEAFARIGAPGLVLEVAYAPSSPKDEQSFRAALVQKRPADLRRGSANIGPHRDELALTIDGHPVRGVASQGQHRAVTLSLKSAEIDVVGNARGVRPILLLDDVSSELDRARTAALFSFLRDQRGQVFLTTTRPELIDTGDDTTSRRDFVVEAGGLRMSR